jgi:hypothetical protein
MQEVDLSALANEVFDTCYVPCDYVPIRSWPLFRARELMPQLIALMTEEPRR